MGNRRDDLGANQKGETMKVDLMRGSLAVLLLLSFQIALAALFEFEVPESNRDMVIYMLGQLSGMVTTALAFYFATSKSSVDKTKVIDDLRADAATAPQSVEIVNATDHPIPVARPEDL
jgi:hypothetical protein